MSLSGPGSIRHPRQPSNRSWREKNTCVAKSFLQAPLKPSPLRDCGAPFRGSILEGRLKGCAWPHRIQLNGFKLLSHESLHHHQLLAEMLKHDLRMKAAMCIFSMLELLGIIPFNELTASWHTFFFCSAAGTSCSWRAWLVRSPQKHKRALTFHQKTFVGYLLVLS